MILINEDKLMIFVTCKKKHFVLKNGNEEDKIIVVYVTKKNKDIEIKGYKYDYDEMKDTKLFTVILPWSKNQKYEIDYIMGDYKEYDYRVNDNYDDNLKIQKMINPKFAMMKYKQLKKKGYISKVVWDKETHFWNIKCNVCGNYESSPFNGRVRPIKSKSKIKDTNNYIEYNHKLYEKVPFNEWFKLTWWTEKEYNKIKENYYPKNPTVDNLMEWTRMFPDFNRLCESQSELRIKDNIKDDRVTLGWYSSFNKDTVDCPICEDLYKITKATDKFIPLRYKIKLKLF